MTEISIIDQPDKNCLYTLLQFYYEIELADVPFALDLFYIVEKLSLLFVANYNCITYETYLLLNVYTMKCLPSIALVKILFIPYCNKMFS